MRNPEVTEGGQSRACACEGRESLMIAGNKGRARHIASWISTALSLSCVLSALFFSVSDSWERTKVLSLMAVYALSIPLFEFGNSGNWFPKFCISKTFIGGLARGLAGIAGVALVLAAIGFGVAFGPGTWKLSSVGFIFGMSSSSYLLLRQAITGSAVPGRRGNSKNQIAIAQ
jgi:hypothetical protein